MEKGSRAGAAADSDATAGAAGIDVDAQRRASLLGAVGLVGGSVGAGCALHDVRDPIVVSKGVLRALRHASVDAADELAVVEHVNRADVRESGIPATVAAATAGVVCLVAGLRPPVADVQSQAHPHARQCGS